MREEWRYVAGYEGLYEVSNLGRVRSTERLDSLGRPCRSVELRPDIRPSGHLRVTFSRDGSVRRFWVHRLVLDAFVGPRPKGTEGCHNDGDPTNNCVENLRWDTKSANALDRVRHGRDAHARNTHCPRGHELTADNIYWDQGGRSRRCRSCTLAWQKADRVRKRLTAGRD